MASGLPARVVVVFTLLGGVAIARAERRPVAVIDVTGTEATAKLAGEVYRVLLGHPDLQPIPDPIIAGALYTEFVDDDVKAIQDAQNSKQTADQQLGSFNFPIAEQAAGNGQSELDKATPSAQALVLYAKLAFVRGQAQLGIRGKTTQARESFALAHRLDPEFVPDAARYLPDVVQAFNAARVHWSGTGKLEIVGEGRLWIDGKDSGTAPVEIEVPAGPHVVWLTGTDRDTRAGYKVVEANTSVKLEIANAPASELTKVRRIRAALRYAPDPTARAAAMKRIAELVGVKDAVLLSSANGKIIVQTWNAGTHKQKPGFSALRERKSERPIDLLEPLDTHKPKQKEEPPLSEHKPIVDNRKWYEKRSYQAGMVATVLAAAIGVYFLYNALTDDTVRAEGGISPSEPTARLRW